MSDQITGSPWSGEELRAELSLRYGMAFSDIELIREGGAFCYAGFSGGRKYLIRRVKPSFRETALLSARALADLERAGVPCPRAVKTLAGEGAYEADGYVCSVLVFIEGRDVDRGEALAEFGETAGLMHAKTPFLTQPRPIPQTEDPASVARLPAYPEPGEDYYIGRYIRYLREKGYPAEKLAFFEEYGSALWRRVRGLPKCFCHGDMHPGNALIGADGRAYLLDFDTACYSYPSFDIAVFCDATDYFRYDPSKMGETLSWTERFLEGYRRYRKPTDAEISGIPDWIAVRHFQVQATILEIFGLDCVDEVFVDSQRDWLSRWRAQTRDIGR